MIDVQFAPEFKRNLLIYYLRTSISIILVTIYSKTEQADISAAQIRRIVGEFQKSE